MPGMNGLELQTALPEKRVVFARHYHHCARRRADLRSSLKAGAVDFREKPVDPDALLMRCAPRSMPTRRAAAGARAELRRTALSTLTAR